MGKLKPLTDVEEARVQAQIAADPDNPEWTGAELARARPMSEVLPELHANILAEIARRKAGRPKLERPKQSIALRLDADVLDAFKASGPGWQTRMNDVLRDWVAKRKRA